MKKMILSLLTLVPFVTITSITGFSIKNEIIALNIEYNDSQGLEVDAGHSPWVWSETEKTTEKIIGDTSFSFDLDDYLSELEQENAFLEFDISESNARSFDEEANLGKFTGDSIVKINELSEKEKVFNLGKTTNAQVGSDYINGIFDVRISKDSENVVEFEFIVKAHAFNSRNGNVNTAGKGIVLFDLNNIYLNY